MANSLDALVMSSTSTTCTATSSSSSSTTSSIHMDPEYDSHLSTLTAQSSWHQELWHAIYQFIVSTQPNYNWSHIKQALLYAAQTTIPMPSDARVHSRDNGSTTANHLHDVAETTALLVDTTQSNASSSSSSIELHLYPNTSSTNIQTKLPQFNTWLQDTYDYDQVYQTWKSKMYVHTVDTPSNQHDSLKTASISSATSSTNTSSSSSSWRTWLHATITKHGFFHFFSK